LSSALAIVAELQNNILSIRFESVEEHYAPLSLSDVLVLRASLDLGYRQRQEAEAGAAALDDWHDLVDVVSDDTEAHVARVLLDNAPQRCLSDRRHHDCLIEYDQPVVAREERACASAKCLICTRTTSTPRSSDALSLSRVSDGHEGVCVQTRTHLEDLLTVVWSIDAPRNGVDCRRLAGAYRAIEQQMGQPVLFTKLFGRARVSRR
jgi:hypothetical protein